MDRGNLWESTGRKKRSHTSQSAKNYVDVYLSPRATFMPAGAEMILVFVHRMNHVVSSCIFSYIVSLIEKILSIKNNTFGRLESQQHDIVFLLALLLPFLFLITVY